MGFASFQFLTLGPVGLFFFGVYRYVTFSQDQWNHISSLASEVAKREGCTLYDIECVGQGRSGRILRVFIEKPSNGVSHDDCANVSRGLSLLLDVDKVMADFGSYNLEVSSPGLERHLRTVKHFQSVVNEEVSLQLNRSLGELVAELPPSLSGYKKFKARLKKVSDSGLTIELTGKANVEVEVPLAEVKKGRLVYDFKTGRTGKR